MFSLSLKFSCMSLETALLNVQNTEPAPEVDFVYSLLCHLFLSPAEQIINLPFLYKGLLNLLMTVELLVGILLFASHYKLFCHQNGNLSSKINMFVSRNVFLKQKLGGIAEDRPPG